MTKPLQSIEYYIGCANNPMNDLESKLFAMRQAFEIQKSQIDAFWFMVQHGWDIEPREYFETEIAKGVGFEDSPLAMCAHYMWKREVKDKE